MNPAVVVVGLAFLLILVGIAMAIAGDRGLRPGTLALVVYWVGVALIVIGLIFLLSPVILWVNAQLHAMLGIH